MNLSAIIIDDEAQNRKLLAKILMDYVPGIEVIGEANTVMNGYQLLNKVSPDIVFLDIEMPGQRGFELLELFEDRKFEVIFITAHDQFTIEAIRAKATDYLLKPIVISDLIKAVERIRQTRIKETNQQSQKLEVSTQKLVVNNLDKIFVLSTEQIIYLKANRAYTTIVTSEKEYLASNSLNTYETQLEEQTFYRSHRSYIINLNKIDYLSKKDGGVVCMLNGAELPVSKSARETILNWLSK